MRLISCPVPLFHRESVPKPSHHPDQASRRKGGDEGLLILGGGDLKPQWIQEAIDAGILLVIVDNVIPGLDDNGACFRRPSGPDGVRTALPANTR